MIVNGIGPNNRLSFGWIISVKPSSNVVEVDSILITSPHGYLEWENEIASVSNSSASPNDVKTDDVASTIIV